MEHTQTLPRPLDPTTFGGTRVAVVLVEILNEHNNRTLANRVSNIIHDYRHTLTALRDVKDPGVYLRVMMLMRREAIASLKVAPENVRTHLANFLTSLYREELAREEGTGSSFARVAQG